MLLRSRFRGGAALFFSRIINGTVTLSLQEKFFRFVAQTSPNPLGFFVQRAEGVYLYDDKDRPILDMIAGLSVSAFGHSHPKIVAAIVAQARSYLHTMVYGESVMSVQVRLAEKIQETLPGPLDNVFFTNTGSEAVEAALKLCKRYTGRSRLVSCRKAYHGSTHGALSVTGEEWIRNAFRPLLPDVVFMRHGDEGDLSLIDEKVAGVIIEIVQGEAGVQFADAAYYKALLRRCEEKGALLIIDEVQTGFGRTGTWWAFEHYHIVPHIVLCAKALGGGLPLGAFVAPKAIMASLCTHPPFGHINTFGGNPLCCAASLAVFDLMQEMRPHHRVEEKARLIVQHLDHPSVRAIRHKGFMLAVEFEDAALVSRVIRHALRLGVLVDTFLFCDTAIRLSPPLVITHEEIKKACHLLNQAIADSLTEAS